jgi:two-component system nitrogen regulation response regulator NtrX
VSSPRVLVVDDEKNICRMLEQTLALEDYEVSSSHDAESALARMQEGESFDAVMLDVRLPGMSGLEALRSIRAAHEDVSVIMMSGHGSIEDAVQAVHMGAADFLEKPLGRDKTLLTLENALRLRSLTLENRDLRAAAGEGELLGESPVMRSLRERIGQVAPTDARVLIQGESGSGKELVARALHRASQRSDRPFLAVNCAAVPAELIESELFGHVKGAFTGATNARAGVFEAADSGTLFLDEIGDMPTPMQAKLLRVLETGVIQRVGTTATRQVDVRIVAATHRDLGRAAREGGFREDLYHRLNVVPLRVPPLRQRGEDIPHLAEHFLRLCTQRQKLNPRRFDRRALVVLGRYRWPGNVRQLRNFVERLAILSPAERIDDAFVEAELSAVIGEEGPSAPAMTLKEAVAQTERQVIERAVRAADGNMSEAARRLGLERAHLYKKARALGMELRG